MNQTNELTPRQAAECRLNYPPGTRILLEHMEDKFAVPDGTRGTVDHVDDAGQIHMRWDNGRTLAIIPQLDSFRKLTKEELTQEQNMVIKVRGISNLFPGISIAWTVLCLHSHAIKLPGASVLIRDIPNLLRLSVQQQMFLIVLVKSMK